SNATVHVLDASRAVGVVSSLLSTKRDDFTSGVAREYEKLREGQKTREVKLLPIDEARAKRARIDGASPRPQRLGVQRFDNVPLDEIEPLIDWNPFFTTWELRGRYPKILEEPRAKELFDDARKLLDEIIEKR